MSLLLATSGDIASRVVAPEGVDFDGVNDYLSRSTDLVGNVDSKTFTFSAWVYIGSITKQFSITTFYTTTNTFQVLFDSGATKNLEIVGRNSAGTIILYATAPISTPSWNTFHNILISIDLANSANRSIYIDDIIVSTTWQTYTNDLIDLTTADKFIGKDSTTSYAKGRLSHVFLSYDYIDLSIEANRRLFITADGKPTPTATLKALNPILYLPLKDNATAHINEGTGGNFTLNGTIATSERGANQDNCVASYFDGTADYLSRTSLTGVADGKQFTFSCTLEHNNSGASTLGVMNFSSGTSDRFRAWINSNNEFTLIAYNSAGTVILNVRSSVLVASRNYVICGSFDLTNTAKRHLYVNGNSDLAAVITYTDDLINFIIGTSPRYRMGANGTSANFFKGNIGELYLDTKYIDLATNNPFWDKDTNKPIPVRKVIANTGVTPLIAMPLDASNAGKNYGTGGDFTANSAPYVGARGASEFWARSASTTGTANYLSKSSISPSNSKTISAVIAYRTTNTTNSDGKGLFHFVGNGGGSTGFKIIISDTGIPQVVAYNATGTNLFAINGVSMPSETAWTILFLSVDTTLTASNQRLIYNGATYVASNVINDFIDIDGLVRVCLSEVSYSPADETAICYFTTDYIDFSQEVNRLKFVDAMGYPTNLKEKIAAGIIPKPLIYLPFDDPTNLGKNLGTGGDFTVNGTVTQGADVNG